VGLAPRASFHRAQPGRLRPSSPYVSHGRSRSCCGCCGQRLFCPVRPDPALRI